MLAYLRSGFLIFLIFLVEEMADLHGFLLMRKWEASIYLLTRGFSWDSLSFEGEGGFFDGEGVLMK